MISVRSENKKATGLRFVIAIIIALSVACGSVAGAVAQTSTPSIAVAMQDCAHKSAPDCPCKHHNMHCFEAGCAQVCGQVLGLATSPRVDFPRIKSAVAASFHSAFKAVAPDVDPPIPRS